MTALDEIAAERARQISLGWTPEYDDTRISGDLARAAAAYALSAANDKRAGRIFPWTRVWWKPKTPREDLIRAAALIVAEIERLDRKAKP